MLSKNKMNIDLKSLKSFLSAILQFLSFLPEFKNPWSKNFNYIIEHKNESMKELNSVAMWIKEKCQRCFAKHVILDLVKSCFGTLWKSSAHKEHQDTLPLPLETVAHGNTQCSDLKLDLCVSLKGLVNNSTSFVESHSVVQYFSKCCYCQYKIII